LCLFFGLIFGFCDPVLTDGFVQGTIGRWLALTALAFMWTSAQIPLYLFGRLLTCDGYVY
jgi:hypothetical protein